jgi:hypothetical protein
MVLTRCDQCSTTYGQGEHDWVIVGYVTTDTTIPDDDLEPTMHFCSWACAGTYATARALVDQ